MNYDLQNFQKAVSNYENDKTIIEGNEHNLNSNNEKLYYVGIPFGFLYSIDKFTISAGVKFSYLISATNYSGSYSSENQQAMALIKDVTSNEVGIYNKFDYSFIFGFEFHVLKDFSIFSRFNYAYSSMINSYSYNENPIGDLFYSDRS
ncbi:MAG: outer membrane beta-barrel protein [Saprospiraceae bacterium]|nr:outer membrane beta-barrel protein [Saprospiraceae bacterium]